MKQIALNLWQAVKELLMPPKAMPLTNKWIELDKQEQYRIAQAKMWDDNHAKKVRPFWHRKLNTTEKNTLRFNVGEDITLPSVVYKNANKKNINHLKLIESIDKATKSNPNFGKHTMSDADYIKCDGNQKKYDRDFINFYAPSDVHFSNEFILSATDSDLDLFDIEGDEDFKKWFFETRNNLINK